MTSALKRQFYTVYKSTLAGIRTDQILERNWKCNETVRQLFTDFRKAHNDCRGGQSNVEAHFD
jgi:hypothetical protein